MEDAEPIFSLQQRISALQEGGTRQLSCGPAVSWGQLSRKLVTIDSKLNSQQVSCLGDFGHSSESQVLASEQHGQRQAARACVTTDRSPHLSPTASPGDAVLANQSLLRI